MCSSILGRIMDENNNYQGDLTDILLRATTTTTTTTEAAAAAYGNNTASGSSHHHHHHHHWQQQQQQQHLSSSSCSSVIEEYPMMMMMRGGNSSMFGDPFSTMRDPFLHDLPIHDIIPPSSASSYFNTTTPPPPVFTHHHHNKVIIEDDDASAAVRPSTTIRPSCKNIFSNIIQISPNNNANLLLPYDSSSSSSSSSSQAMAAASSSSPSTAIIKPNSGGVVPSNIMVNANNKDSLMDININNTTSSLQISSPRNPGLKRRKNQAKKVVCIPAPAAANSRQTGEVVPSDLWAWRKYGQKPIKGSPYPRGYYRCSSSKGCSARKQVERSRTDPNMLVITYTSEHNHPWPTQRNALAGSTRSQPSKNNNNNNASNSSKNSSETSHQKGTTTKPKEENNHQHQQAETNSEGNNNNNNNNIVSSPVISASVKEEMEDIEKQLLIDESMVGDDGGEFSSDGPSVLPNYKPSMMMMMDDDDDDQGNNNNNNNSSEDFFAELGEIEADPLNLLFSTHQGFNAGGAGAADDQIQRESKALDPFNIFDWSGGDTTINTNSFEDHNNKGRL